MDGFLIGADLNGKFEMRWVWKYRTAVGGHLYDGREEEAGSKRRRKKEDSSVHISLYCITRRL